MARILLIDDNARLLDAMNEPLELAGHHVASAGNGVEALKLVRTESFDLVITDLVMPEKEGLETIIELRRLYPRLRIIAMSGGMGGDPTHILHMAELFGAVRTLGKPFTGKQLVALVESVLAGP